MANTTNLLPRGKTPATLGQVLDASIYGVVLPLFQTEPTDALFGDVAPVDGTVVLQAGATDNYYVQWVRINGTWRGTFMAT